MDKKIRGQTTFYILDTWVNFNLVVKFKLTVDIIDVVLSQGDCLEQGDTGIVNHGNEDILWDEYDITSMNSLVFIIIENLIQHVFKLWQNTGDLPHNH